MFPNVRVIEPDPFIFEIDEGATYTYIGQAVPGAAQSAPVWRVRRVEESTGSSRLADKGKFSSVWNDRASLSYA